jgi:hypothetical protein
MGITITAIATFLLKQVAEVILGSGTFDRVQGVIARWEQKELSGLEKQAGAKAEMEMLGIQLTSRLANWAIETAVLLLKDKVE